MTSHWEKGQLVQWQSKITLHAHWQATLKLSIIWQLVLPCIRYSQPRTLRKLSVYGNVVILY